MSNEVIRYENLTLDEAKAIADNRGIILVPAATTEGHGNHLPLSTDTLIAEYLCSELSKITGLPALIPTRSAADAPPLSTGIPREIPCTVRWLCATPPCIRW